MSIGIVLPLRASVASIAAQPGTAYLEPQERFSIV